MKIALLLAAMFPACMEQRPPAAPPAPCICFMPVRCPDAGFSRCDRVVGCQSPLCPRAR